MLESRREEERERERKGIREENYTVCALGHKMNGVW